MPCAQPGPRHAGGSSRGLRPLPLKGGTPCGSLRPALAPRSRGDRGAPARGVDVKPLRQNPSGGVPSPLRGLRRAPEGSGEPPGPREGVPGWPGVPGTPGTGPRRPREGGFTSTPLRDPEKVPKKAKFGQNGQKWPKSPKMAFFPVFGVFWAFPAPWGLPGALALRGFTSTPRAGPPRFRGVPGGGWPASAAQAPGGPSRIGRIRGSPPGSVAVPRAPRVELSRAPYL